MCEYCGGPRASGRICLTCQLTQSRARLVHDLEEINARTPGEAEAAALRVGRTLDGIARTLYRAGRPDLGRPYSAAARRRYRGPHRATAS